MNNKSKIWIIGIIAFSFITTLLTFVFNKDAPPVSEFKIPATTLDFFKKLSDLSHIKIKLVDSLKLDDYDNNKDYGSNESDFKKIEDANFIVYYRD